MAISSVPVPMSVYDSGSPPARPASTPLPSASAPSWSATPIARGFLNLQYRDGLSAAKALVPGEAYGVRVRFAPQDHTVLAGHRIGVIIAGSNVVWAVPDTPAGSELTIDRATLRLPVVGPERPKRR